MTGESVTREVVMMVEHRLQPENTATSKITAKSKGIEKYLGTKTNRWIIGSATVYLAKALRWSRK